MAGCSFSIFDSHAAGQHWVIGITLEEFDKRKWSCPNKKSTWQWQPPPHAFQTVTDTREYVGRLGHYWVTLGSWSQPRLRQLPRLGWWWWPGSQLRQGLLGYTSDSSVHVCPPWPWQPKQSYLAALGQPVCPPQHSPARPTLQHRPRIDDSCASYSFFSLARLSTSEDAMGTSQLRRGRFRQYKQTCHNVSRATSAAERRLALVSGHLPTGQALDLPWKRLTQLHARPPPLSKTADSSLPILQPYLDGHLVFLMQKHTDVFEMFSINSFRSSSKKEPFITQCSW